MSKRTKKSPKKIRFKEEKLFIHLDALSVTCIIGINEEERLHEQNILVSLSLELDKKIDTSGVTTAESVDWCSLGAEVTTLLVDHKFYLAEEAARQVARLAISHNRVRSVEVKITKPHAYPGIGAVSAEAWLTR